MLFVIVVVAIHSTRGRVRETIIKCIEISVKKEKRNQEIEETVKKEEKRDAGRSDANFEAEWCLPSYRRKKGRW